MEGDNSQVEMKLSSDMDEEVGGNGTGEHLNHNSSRKPYVAQRLGHTPKNLCFMASATLLIFIIGKRATQITRANCALLMSLLHSHFCLLSVPGYLIGYLVHQKKDMAAKCTDTFIPLQDNVVQERGAAPLMDWDDVKKLYAEKLKTSNFESVFK